MARDIFQPNQALQNDSNTPTEKRTKMRSCIACTTQLPAAELVEVRCADEYCHKCLESLFEGAMKDETMYPPSCCGFRIPLKTAEKQLPRALVKSFKAKQLELETKDKTYCYKPQCSAFIAPHSIHNHQAICQACRAVTCSECKNVWHYGPCSESEDTALIELMRSSKWKKCPVCKRMVEKLDGCRHVVYVDLGSSERSFTEKNNRCRCGTEFCYGCGQRFEAGCTCSDDSEEDDDEEYDDDTDNE